MGDSPGYAGAGAGSQPVGASPYYVQELDTTLSLLEDYLLNFAVNDNSVSKLHSADTNARAIAKAEVFERPAV